MDDLLPSYESAVQKDPWKFIARYLPSDDLCSAALVCRKWHETFTPNLWGNPASHFGVQNDTVYVALTRFKRTLPYARLLVRELTHTLHFPPAHAEIYGGPHAEWLRDCLEHLPHLQCLIVDGLPFFDHASLLNLRHASRWWQSNRQNTFPIFSLRLLDASGCKNVTSTGLIEGLPHFPDLVSLDLSGTLAAKDEAVLRTFVHLRHLRVLSLKSLGLRDAEFSIITKSIATRVRSLDMSDNQLTDVSARLLLEHCLRETVHGTHHARAPLPPVETGQLNSDLDVFQTENLVGHVRKKLTEGFIGRLAIEEASGVGITHLYLSRNNITVEGISGLLRSRRLQVLDVGLLPSLLKRPGNNSPGFVEGGVELPGVSKLTPVLSEYASAKLQYLRINYEIITEDAPFEIVSPSHVELPGDFGRYVPSNAQELPAIEPPLPELSSVETAVIELAGDSSYPVEFPGSSPAPSALTHSSTNSQDMPSRTRPLSETPTITITPEAPQVKRGAAYAPEPVLVDSPLSPISPMSYGNDVDGPIPTLHSIDEQASLSPMTPSFQPEPIDSPSEHIRTRSRQNSAHYVEDRRASLERRQSLENRLHPGTLSQVHTLVLTEVPTTTTNRDLINRLVQYIKDAAEEASIAKQRARHTYILPPGRTRATAEREYARSLFALRRIVLEVVPPPAAPRKAPSSWRTYPTKSSTEDPDSEAFWAAAAHDFSFFDDDDECGLPSLEPGRTLPLAAMSGLEVAPASLTAPSEEQKRVQSSAMPVLDVVTEIGAFRRERKAAYNNLVQMGEVDPEVEGYWPGDITVVRKPVSDDAGELDCYGNRYEAGWHYR